MVALRQPHTQPYLTPSVCSALSEPEWPQQANSCVTKRQNKHVCIDAQACERVAELKRPVKIVGVKVGVN